MKSQYIKTILLSSLLGMTSCESVKNSNHQQKGTAVGTSTGAVIGGILGNNVGSGNNAAIGAVIGAVVGGATGNVIGKKMDNQAKQIQQTLPGAEVERVGEAIKVTLDEDMVSFAFNSAELTDITKVNLDKLAEVLTANPDTNINIYGHTDSKGSDEYNLTLSQKRADNVKAYLVTKGIAASRLFSKGEGEAYPIASNDTEEGRAKNRRVEFAITANEKMINDAQKQQ